MLAQRTVCLQFFIAGHVTCDSLLYSLIKGCAECPEETLKFQAVLHPTFVSFELSLSTLILVSLCAPTTAWILVVNTSFVN